jgi:hypothetical protein
MNSITLKQILDITGNRFGVIDSSCPFCSHMRKPAKQRAPCAFFRS